MAVRKAKRANAPSRRAAGDWVSAGGAKSYVLVGGCAAGQSHYVVAFGFVRMLLSVEYAYVNHDR